MIRQSHDLGFAPTQELRHLQLRRRARSIRPIWENVGDAGKYLCTENVGLPQAELERQDQGVRRRLPARSRMPIRRAR